MKKIVLITGGSRGIGAATALAAGQAGYHVCINYRKNQSAAKQVAETIQKSGGYAQAFQADVSSESDVLRMFQAISNSFGKITHLVNNAGTLEKKSRLEDMSVKRWQNVFATNTLGSFLCIREAIKHMSVRHGGQGGSIVNVSSAAARLGSPFEFIDYAATKGAMDTMTIGLGKELAEDKIRVNGVRPGLIFTDIHALSGQPNRIEDLVSGVPMKRGGQPAEVANLIMWLLSEEASYITGANIDVTGGR